VADRGIADDGGIADLPWAAVFDPAANARVLSSVQARGFRAATEIVNRFVQLAESTSPPDDAHGGPAEPTGGPDVERLLGFWRGLVGQLAQSLTKTAAAPQTGTATFDFVNVNASGHVHLETAEPGAVSGEVWLHNGGPADLGKVRLRCSDLLAHDGSLIDSACVRFEPDVVLMPARSSRGVTVEVDVVQEHQPGCYRGTLLADGHADVWMPVVLNIRPRV